MTGPKWVCHSSFCFWYLLKLKIAFIKLHERRAHFGRAAERVVNKLAATVIGGDYAAFGAQYRSLILRESSEFAIAAGGFYIGFKKLWLKHGAPLPEFLCFWDNKYILAQKKGLFQRKVMGQNIAPKVLISPRLAPAFSW